jgi:hypothetical protein
MHWSKKRDAMSFGNWGSMTMVMTAWSLRGCVDVSLKANCIGIRKLSIGETRSMDIA